MKQFTPITLYPQIIGGKGYIHGMRVTIGTIIDLLAVGLTEAEILEAYPYLEEADIRQALAYAAGRVVHWS